MFKLLIRLSAMSIALCYATPSCQSQLSSLSERMNEMINTLYSSSLFSKATPPSAKTTSDESTKTSYETPWTIAPGNPASPQVIYVSQPPPAPLPVAPAKHPRAAEEHQYPYTPWPHAYPVPNYPGYPSYPSYPPVPYDYSYPDPTPYRSYAPYPYPTPGFPPHPAHPAPVYLPPPPYPVQSYPRYPEQPVPSYHA